MKIRKIIAAAAAVAMAASISAVMPVSAASNVIDFEDGNMSFARAQIDDGGDLSVVSVVDFNGSKQLKVDVQDCTLTPKIAFDINAILGDNNMSKVSKITMDVTAESKDGTTPPGWVGGCIGTVGSENIPGWSQGDWEGGEYENAVSAPFTIERKFLLPAQRFVDGTPETTMLFMRWATDVPYNLYLDNITFYDNDGNAIELNITAPAAAAPAADSSNATATPGTGNTAVAAIIAVMAIAGATTIVVKKRK